jgi:vacuolar-type H+-ATPase subunit H
MSDLMQKLAMSNVREIMNQTSAPRRAETPSHMVQEFDMPQAKYNIPQEFLQEQPSIGQGQQPYLSELPRVNTKPVGNPTVDAIKNSKLPDDIKRLMMEHPISQPQQQEATLSNDLIQRASRLMKQDQSGYVPESAKPKTQSATTTAPQQTASAEKINYKLIQKMINEAVNNALRENGLIMESAEKSNEIFSFKVGKHVFEGKVTKIKKLA